VDRKAEEMRAHQKRMDEINAKIAARENELRRIDDEKRRRQQGEAEANSRDRQNREEEYRRKAR
jgi:hypothetical protein